MANEKQNAKKSIQMQTASTDIAIKSKFCNFQIG